MIFPMILLIICLILTIVFFIMCIREDEAAFLVPSFIFSLLGVGLIMSIIYETEKSTNKEEPTREVDYSIILIPFDKVEITDKHGNRDTIQFESLQYFIEQDNK